jgi:hypothetical protein
MPMLKIVLLPTEREALLALADRELRDPRQQAAVIIRRELQRRGLLPADNTPDAHPAQEVQHAQAS